MRKKRIAKYKDSSSCRLKGLSVWSSFSTLSQPPALSSGLMLLSKEKLVYSQGESGCVPQKCYILLDIRFVIFVIGKSRCICTIEKRLHV